MSPENKSVSRGTRGRWGKGQSGNPGGRPAGMRSAVHAIVGKDGKKAVKALALLAFGKQPEIDAFFGQPTPQSARDRREAILALLDRGFGKPTQTIEAPDGSALPSVLLIKHEPA